MTTVSRPAVYDSAAIAASAMTEEDANLTGATWDRVNRRNVGVDTGFVMTLNSGTNQATLSTGFGVWRGFDLSITVAHVLSVPAVSSATTYTIGVLYSPANYSTSAGPLSLVVGIKGSITIPTGGNLYTLYEIDRTSAQTLENSVTRNYRVARASGGFFRDTDRLEPAAAEYTFGTLMFASDAVTKIRLAPSNVATWVPLATGTAQVAMNSLAGWVKQDAWWKVEGNSLSFRVDVTKGGTATITAGTNGSLGDSTVTFAQIPASGAGYGALRPTAGWPVTATVVGVDNSTFGAWGQVNPDGNVFLTSCAPGLQIQPGARIIIAGSYPLPA